MLDHTGKSATVKRARDKGDPTKLIADLAFAFFGHQPDFTTVKGNTAAVEEKYEDHVLELLELVYSAIQNESFDVSLYELFDNDYLDEFFRRKKFYQIKSALKNRRVDLTGKRNRFQRGVFRGILLVAKDIFQWDVEIDVIINAREITNYDPIQNRHTDVSSQRKAISQILDRIEDFTDKNPPDWSITFENLTERPIIKTDRTGSFSLPSLADRDGRKLTADIQCTEKLLLHPRRKSYIAGSF